MPDMSNAPERKWIGPFRILGLLGSGATGHVFLAEDPSLDRKVAIKILKTDFKYDSELRNRFLREARNMARLSHPGVVSVHAVGDEEGLPYMVMEYLQATDLLTAIEKQGALSWSTVVSIFIDVTEGLWNAYAEGIVHRDVKPANIFLAAENRAKIGDFGLARALEMDANLTADGVVIGTPDYLAPEVISGVKATVESDVYALGCSMFHAMAGHPPYRFLHEDISGQEVLSRHIKATVPMLDNRQIPRALRKLIYDMMNKKPGARPTYEKIVNALRRAMRPKDYNSRAMPAFNPGRTAASSKTAASPIHPSSTFEDSESEPELDLPAVWLVVFGVLISAAILTLATFGLS